MAVRFMSSVIIGGILILCCATISYSAVCNEVDFTAPSVNVDGSALIDLAGFKVYFSSTTGTESTGTVKDVGMDSATGAGYDGAVLLSTLGLVDGNTYFFVMTAYNIYGRESAFSNEISCSYDVTVPQVPVGILLR